MTTNIAAPEDFVPGARFEIVADPVPAGYSFANGPIPEHYESDEDPLALYVGSVDDPWTTRDARRMVVTYYGNFVADGLPYGGVGPTAYRVRFEDGIERMVSRGNVRPLKED